MATNEFGLTPALKAALDAATEQFYQAVGKALGAKPDVPVVIGFPPAHDEATMLENVRSGFGIDGSAGRQIVPTYQLESRKHRLKEAFLVGDAAGVPRPMFEAGFLLGQTEFQDGKDIADPNDPNPATPSFNPPYQYLSNFSGMSLQSWLDETWRIREQGGTPSGK